MEQKKKSDLKGQLELDLKLPGDTGFLENVEDIFDTKDICSKQEKKEWPGRKAYRITPKGKEYLKKHSPG